MSPLRSLWAGLQALFQKKQVEREMDEELHGYLDAAVKGKMRSGMSQKDALRAARVEMGSLDAVKEEIRIVGWESMLETLWQDVHYGLRMLARNRGFTAAATLTLALGIGANTAMFSVVYGVLLKPLRYEEPDQLVQVWEAPDAVKRNSVSPGVFLDWRQQNKTFEGLAAVRGTARNLADTGEPERLIGVAMSANSLRIFRARPLLGRTFDDDEDEPGKDKVVILTERLWQRRFGGDPKVVGRFVRLDSESYTVIGVLPPGFLPFDKPDFVVPYVFDSKFIGNRSNHFLRVIGRLKPGVSVAQAQAELATISQRFKPLYPIWKRDWGVAVVPMHEELVGNIRPTLFTLLGAVGLVMLIACANVANLLLAKATARKKEIALRRALGASRWRVIRQLLAESVLLSLFGATLGVGLAVGGVGLFRRSGAANLPRMQEVGVDWHVLAFVLVVSMATGVVFGLAPAVQASRPDLNRTLKEGGRGAITGSRSPVRNGLIVSEIALALILLVGAGLLLNSFLRLSNVAPGFEPRNALTMQVTLPSAKYPDAERRGAFFVQVLERIEALPGVAAAGVSVGLPLTDLPPNTLIKIAGRAEGRPGGYPADFEFCTPGYFHAMGIPLRKGRLLDQHDSGSSSRMIVVNETLAREYFPNEDPLGHRLIDGMESWEIVGIVGDVHLWGLAEPVRPVFYMPLAASSFNSGNLIVRTKAAPLVLVESIRKTVLDVDPEQPVANIQRLEDIVAGSVSQRRLVLTLLMGFAGSALLLAAVGLYGVTAYAVSQRTREIGIRVALGAQRREVLGMVLGQGASLAAVGIAVGVAGALGLTRVLANQLYTVTPTDPTTFVGISVILLLVSLLASWLPARRATKVDPMVALRYE